ncbi:MAG TPA: four helix bundle protein [Tepidisphaeraceae bacterium]|jgi:four helix bundle protein
MPTYKRFEDLPVWNAAIDLGIGVFSLVDAPAFAPLGDLRNQLQRASLSISNNIAEGFERGTTNDLIWFLYIARGSAGETRSALHFSNHLPQLQQFRSQISKLITQSESVSRQLGAWLTSLQNSDIPGQRHLNDHSQLDYTQRKRAEEFLEKLRNLTHRPELNKPEDE